MKPVHRIYHLHVRLQEYIVAIDAHGCTTGDCPHETQAECNAELDSFATEIESELAALKQAGGASDA